MRPRFRTTLCGCPRLSLFVFQAAAAHPLPDTSKLGLFWEFDASYTPVLSAYTLDVKHSFGMINLARFGPPPDSFCPAPEPFTSRLEHTLLTRWKACRKLQAEGLVSTQELTLFYDGAHRPTSAHDHLALAALALEHQP